MAALPCCPVVELRQYTLHPGRREALVELFERAFIEPQEAAGMRLIGQFRDLDRPDRFVWLRGFSGMRARHQALAAFYGGPVWRAHRDQANATMIDSDDVLLLRPVEPRSGFPGDEAPPGPGALVTATICASEAPVDDALVARFEREVRPALAAAGAPPVAVLRTETAANTFPALPVRTDVNALVWFARAAGPDPAALAAALGRPVTRLRLGPTPRSRLR